jgi:hypothetical protein
MEQSFAKNGRSALEGGGEATRREQASCRLSVEKPIAARDSTIMIEGGQQRIDPGRPEKANRFRCGVRVRGAAVAGRELSKLFPRSWAIFVPSSQNE